MNNKHFKLVPLILNANLTFTNRIYPFQKLKEPINKYIYFYNISLGKPHYEIDPWSENKFTKACNNSTTHRSVSESSALTFNFISYSFH